MNTSWKKSAAVAALSIALLAYSGSASAGSAYKAKEDDTFWKLSRQFGVGIEKLMAANPKVDPLNIYEGIELVIPAAAEAKQSNAAAKKAAQSPAAKPASTMKMAAVSEDKETIQVGSKEYSFTEVIQAKASAYTAAASENGGWGAVDYFGNPLKVGTIAVDPKKIPLGTKVYVTGYDYDGLPAGGMIATASDMGGAIKGDRIDIFVPHSQKQALTFGYQYVKVFVLE
ncbi:LysM peptidoglycan-binding domain-containing protein [Paenibacillus oenotherae]|uniref:LysM peptidoglycan-binding domain-containing protein n=1 Tax=Paenibacillus oenotherae TaxID=1435645 RepID=A0ABS7D398_9BACL|nr:3D domain-containing protein [Paenibacillus oenotherae]MBW7474378.1 LysM peptidoglycan-binding domain-containing protein [Paenibacillus oenotherae]